MKKLWIAAAIFAALAIVIGCARQPDEAKSKTELLVSAAASLKDSLDEIERAYEKAHPDIQITFNYGSSGTLQKQMEQGAPADLFFSAGTKQMDALVKQNLISKSETALRNELVVVVPKDSELKINTIKLLTQKTVGKVAIGQPETVPAGQYAKESLNSSELWDDLQNKLVFAKDVRQVLTYIETGNADAGFVYKTDALTSDKIRIALYIWPSVHSPIEYPLGIVKATKHAEEAANLYTYLQSNEASGIFRKYGFQIY